MTPGKPVMLMTLGIIAVVAAVLLLKPAYRIISAELDEIKLPSHAVPALPGSYRPGVLAMSLDAGNSELPVDVWYPSGDPPRETAAALDDVHHDRRALPDAGPSAEPHKFPVLLFAPGWNGDRRSNTFMASALASEGYVVVAMNDVGGDKSPQGDAALDFDFSSEQGFKSSWQLAERRLQLMQHRVSAILDALEKYDAQDPDWPLAKRLDFTRIGMFGFSFGGTVAAAAPGVDPRIKAAANLDGWLMGAVPSQGVKAPYLSYSSEFPGIEAATTSWSPGKRMMALATVKDRRIQRALLKEQDRYAMIIKGTQHGDYSDEVFAPALKSYLHAPWGLWKEGQLRIHEIVTSTLIAFFDRYLRQGGGSELLDGRPSPFPEVIWLDPQT